MPPQPLDDVVQNVNDRLTRAEQILPALATKTDLAEAVALLATKAELKEEGERTRRYFDVVAERLEGHIRLLAEGQVALRENLDARFGAMDKRLDGLDRRLMRVAVARG